MLLRKNFKVYSHKNGQNHKYLASFNSRQDAVYYCKVNQTLPLPDYEWEDEFYIKPPYRKIKHERYFVN